jgi:hypothetical protein
LKWAVWFVCAVALLGGFLDRERYAARDGELLLLFRYTSAVLGLVAAPWLRRASLRSLLPYVFLAVLLTTAAQTVDLFEGSRFLSRSFFESAGLLALVAWAAFGLGRLAAPATAFVATLCLLELGLAGYAHVSDSPLFWDSASAAAELRRQRPKAPTYFGFRLNRGGYHDHEFFRAGPRDRVVALLADSFGLGIVPYPDHFATIAEAHLRHGLDYERVAIHNFGVSAIGMREYLLLLESEALDTNPNLVALCIFVGNDMEGLVRRQRSRQALQGWWLWILSSRLVLVGREALPALSDVDVPAWTPDAEEVPTFSEARFLEIERARLRVLDPDQDFEPFFEALDVFHATLGPRLALVVIPDEFQVNDSLFEQLEGTLAHRDLPQQRIQAWANARAVPTLDLLPALRAAEADGRTYHLRDTHWNARGNRVAGEALGRFLLELLKRNAPARERQYPGGG